MRDIYKQVAQGEKFLQQHERAQLSIDEILQFTERYNEEMRMGYSDAVVNVVIMAFKMGVAVGVRNA